MMGAYIVHPKYENTRKPKILAHARDKVFRYAQIQGTGSFDIKYTKLTGAGISLCRIISLG